MIEVKPLNLTPDQPILNNKPKPKLLWPALIIVILLGAASGYGLANLKKTKPVQYLSRTATDETLKKGGTFGVDEKSFRDSAEGEIAKGGIDGEGSHHLIREGGESQYVYLTSSIIDLDQFAGKKVKVWGETFQAQKAGWLMDVGRLEITE